MIRKLYTEEPRIKRSGKKCPYTQFYRGGSTCIPEPGYEFLLQFQVIFVSYSDVEEFPGVFFSCLEIVICQNRYKISADLIRLTPKNQLNSTV